MPLDYNEKTLKQRKAGQLFSPRTPITGTELFSGRYDQILKLNSTIAQPGAHAIIYGERGVGKTSLANIAPMAYSVQINTDPDQVVAPRVACDSTDSFDSLWRKVFKEITIVGDKTPMGLIPHLEDDSHSLLDDISEGKLTPGEVMTVLKMLGKQCHLIIALDEFDRLPKGEVPQLVADLIKSLSDNNIPATIIIVGVGDSIAELVRGHESVGRHIVEVPLPRMSRSELEKIILDRLPKLDMTIETSALKFISLVCSGLPYYTHLLAQHAVCMAISKDASVVSKHYVDAAMKKAIGDSEREMKSAYYEATHSRQPRTFFAETLAACALADHDEFGYFTAANIREPLGRIRKLETDIPTFTAHLERFCKKEKGAILQQSGDKHQRRYRFRDPLMQPFIIIRSLDDKKITVEEIKAGSHTSR
jgi:Cdc6-like AAA superfamily ATPase